MFLIAHRGNVNGKDPEQENRPEYILQAINHGYHVEVDVWSKDGKLYLGHDKPEYQTDIKFLQNDKLWCHCKNIEALKELLEGKAHCFFHQGDDVTLTSKGYMWVFPNKKLVKNSICILPEVGYSGKLEDCIGICSDHIGSYK